MCSSTLQVNAPFHTTSLPLHSGIPMANVPRYLGIAIRQHGQIMLLLFQMPDSNASQASVDFETLNEDTLADEFEGGDFLQDTVVHGLVEVDSVLGLILDLSFRPLLLLSGFATTRRCCCFCFGLGSDISVIER